MKKIKLTFLIVIVLISALKSEICFSQLGSFDSSYILLSSSSYDYKNPQFDKSQSSVNYSIKDCIFSYEKWNSTFNSNIAVRFMRFNSLGNEEMLTNDSNLNINPAVSYFTFQPENNPGAIVYQTNRNGNWDIYFSSIKGGNWSQPFNLTTGVLNEITPAIVGNTINNINYYLVTYQRERDVFIKSYYNGIWTLKLILPKKILYFQALRN